MSRSLRGSARRIRSRHKSSSLLRLREEEKYRKKCKNVALALAYNQYPTTGKSVKGIFSLLNYLMCPVANCGNEGVERQTQARNAIEK